MALTDKFPTRFRQFVNAPVVQEENIIHHFIANQGNLLAWKDFQNSTNSDEFCDFADFERIDVSDSFVTVVNNAETTSIPFTILPGEKINTSSSSSFQQFCQPLSIPLHYVLFFNSHPIYLVILIKFKHRHNCLVIGFNLLIQKLSDEIVDWR